MEFQSPGKELC